MATKSKDLGTAARNAAGQQIVAALVSLQQKAHGAGLTVTGHGLNNAMNACGWEMAGNTDRAGKATRGER